MKDKLKVITRTHSKAWFFSSFSYVACVRLVPKYQTYLPKALRGLGINSDNLGQTFQCGKAKEIIIVLFTTYVKRCFPKLRVTVPFSYSWTKSWTCVCLFIKLFQFQEICSLNSNLLMFCICVYVFLSDQNHCTGNNQLSIWESPLVVFVSFHSVNAIVMTNFRLSIWHHCKFGKSRHNWHS